MNILKNLLDLVTEEKRRQDKMRTVQTVAIGIGITGALCVATGIILATKKGKNLRTMLKEKAIISVENIKDTIQDKANTINVEASRVARKADKVIKEMNETAEAMSEK